MRGSECLVVPWPLSIRQTEFVFRLRYSFTLLVLLYVDTGEPPMAPNLKISNKVMVRPCENNNPRQLVANQEHLQRSKRSKMLLSFACILLCFVRQLRKMPPAACANQGRSSEDPNKQRNTLRLFFSGVASSCICRGILSYGFCGWFFRVFFP
jgi:hypothetical protein